jgi:hypothetical protein
VLGVLFTDVFYSKLPTTREKMMGRHSCFHRPGVVSLCEYPCSFNRFARSSCAMIPAWGNPYMPLRISHYTYPSGVVTSSNF